MNIRFGLAMLALGLAMIAALTSTAASAAPVGTTGTAGQVNKLKSIWGGGWVLNVGQT